MRRGWCPTVHEPMASGDGLLIRVKPFGGRLSSADLMALADVAARCGNGTIELTSRGNLQLRGFCAVSARAAAAALVAAGLADADPARERRRNVIAVPGCDERLVAEIEAVLAGIEGLAPKFCVAVGEAAADVVVRDGGVAARGVFWPCEAADVPEMVRRIAEDARGSRTFPPPLVGGDGGGVDAARRSRSGANRSDVRAAAPLPPAPSHKGRGSFLASPLPLREGMGEGAATADTLLRHRLRNERVEAARPASPPPPTPSRTGRGSLVHLPFGQTSAAALQGLAGLLNDALLRTTPWRAFHRETPLDPAALAALGFVTDPDDPRLTIAACPGAPACASGTVPARTDAVLLAKLGLRNLHVSGCAKGCSHHAPATTLVGRNGRYDLIRHGRAGDPPDAAGLSLAEAAELLA